MVEKIKFEPEKEDKLRRFIYRDNSADGKIIFQCVAKNILEADAMYKEEIGQEPAKQNHIGCSIEKVETKNKGS